MGRGLSGGHCRGDHHGCSRGDRHGPRGPSGLHAPAIPADSDRSADGSSTLPDMAAGPSALTSIHSGCPARPNSH